VKVETVGQEVGRSRVGKRLVGLWVEGESDEELEEATEDGCELESYVGVSGEQEGVEPFQDEPSGQRGRLGRRTVATGVPADGQEPWDGVEAVV
jgi:hypothetical protein